MSSHEKALEKKHSHKKNKEGKCVVCSKNMEKVENEDDEEGKELNEKGKRPKPEFGAKNNDSQED